MSWRIGSKLKGISFAGAALACVLGVVGLRGLRTVNSTMTTMRTTDVALSNHKDADMMHDALRGDVLAALLAPDDAALKEANDDLTEHAALFRQLLTANLALPLDDTARRALVDAQPVREQYIANAESMLSEARHDRASAKAKVPRVVSRPRDAHGRHLGDGRGLEPEGPGRRVERLGLGHGVDAGRARADGAGALRRHHARQPQHRASAEAGRRRDDGHLVGSWRPDPPASS